LNDFEFIVGEAHYRCPWFVASFLSSRIASVLAIDNTICAFSIATKDPRNEFSQFLSFGRGERITIGHDNFSFYESLSDELLNEELSAVVYEGFMNDVTLDNVFERLERRHRLNFDISWEVKFIASHLYEIAASELKHLDLSILFMIFSSQELKIKSDDWLYKVIWDLVEDDRLRFSLVQFVEFEFVSPTSASRFLENAGTFLDLIDSSIWSSLGRRFVQPVSPSTSSCRLIFQGKRFHPSGRSLSGIVSYLTSKHRGNVHDLGIIEVTSSSLYSPAYHPKNTVNLQNHSVYSEFMTQGEPNPWICYDMKNLEITLTHYSILSCQAGPNQTSHPKSWCMEVSVDGRGWTEVHRCTDNSDLNGSNQICTYKVTGSIRCRFIRLRQTGKNHYGNDRFRFCGLELFGILCES
jgi:hypothetical protein